MFIRDRRNRLGRRIVDNREEWIQACGRVRTLVAEAKRVCWEEFVENLEGHSQSTLAWGLVQSLSGKAPWNRVQGEESGASSPGTRVPY